MCTATAADRGGRGAGAGGRRAGGMAGEWPRRARESSRPRARSPASRATEGARTDHGGDDARMDQETRPTMPRRAAPAPDAEFKSGAEVCEKSDTDSDNKKFKNRAAPGAVGAGAGDFDFCVWGRRAGGDSAGAPRRASQPSCSMHSIEYAAGQLSDTLFNLLFLLPFLCPCLCPSGLQRLILLPHCIQRPPSLMDQVVTAGQLGLQLLGSGPPFVQLAH